MRGPNRAGSTSDPHFALAPAGFSVGSRPPHVEGPGRAVAPRLERRRIALVALLSPGQRASFSFHVLDWVRDREKPSQPAVAAEIGKLRSVPVLCVYGADERQSACPGLPSGLATVESVPGGHHLGSDGRPLGERILAELANAAAGRPWRAAQRARSRNR